MLKVPKLIELPSDAIVIYSIAFVYVGTLPPPNIPRVLDEQEPNNSLPALKLPKFNEFPCVEILI